MARAGSVFPGVLAILLGIWTGAGGCLYAVSALGGRGGEIPDNPFLSGAQNRAVQELMLATASYDPVNAAVSALSALVGPILIIAGILLLSGSASAGLVGRVAFGASIFADAAQALWSVVWYAIVWEPMVAYVQAIAKGMRQKPPGMMDTLDQVTGVAIVLTALLGVLYFGVKIVIAVLGLLRSARLDQEPVDERPPMDPDLGWAD